MSQPNMLVQQNHGDAKDPEIFLEDQKHIANDDGHHEQDLKATEFSENQLKSELDTLPLMKAIWAFRRVFLLCTIAGFTASTDGECLDCPVAICLSCKLIRIAGFQNQISGSILANKGFIRHISNGQYINPKTGAWALDPTWVSVFNGIFR
jgi:hypothetical protein